MTLDNTYLTANEQIDTLTPNRLPGRRILLAFFNDYFVDSSSPLTTSTTYEYNFSMDPVFVYSTGYVETKFREWIAEKESELPTMDPLAYGYYDTNSGVNAGISNFFKMIATAIDSAKLAGASADLWVSIPGSFCANNATTSRVLFGSPWEVLREHMRAIEPDFVIIVNRDMNYLRGYDMWDSGNNAYNTWTKNGSNIYSSSIDYWPQVDQMCQMTGSQLIIPAMVHGDMKHRSHYTPRKGDMDNILDWNDGHTPKASVNPDYLISQVKPTTDGGAGLMPDEQSRSMFANVVYGDLFTGTLDEETDNRYKYINCAPAVGALMASLGFVWQYRPAVNKDLRHQDVYYDLTEEQVADLTRFDVNIMPIRRTIRNGICLAGNHTFKTIYDRATVSDTPSERTNHASFPVTRIHNVVLANAVRREAQVLCDNLIGKGKPHVLGAIKDILTRVMNTKPIQSWTHDIIDHDIDHIEAIISIRVLNTVSDIVTSVRVSNIDT
jgi:hypothetical protein